jgi:hypothetical protein
LLTPQKAYTETEKTPMIQCDNCQSWVHAECDHISEQEYQSLSVNDTAYTCPTCRDRKKKGRKGIPNTRIDKKRKRVLMSSEPKKRSGMNKNKKRNLTLDDDPLIQDLFGEETAFDTDDEIEVEEDIDYQE